MFGCCSAGCSNSSKGCLLSLSHGVEEGAVAVPDSVYHSTYSTLGGET